MAQNSDWSQDEHILALEFYMRNPASPPGKSSREILELSQTLRRLGDQTDATMSETFRNPNGVYMKLMNFRRFDPAFQSQGKSGLSAGSQGEELVWNKYANDVAALKAVAQAIRARIDDGPIDSTSQIKVDVGAPEEAFVRALEKFKTEIETAQKGVPFHTFNDGVAAVMEAYKPRLRDHALELLRPNTWITEDIGSGRILDATISAVEIQEQQLNLINNLVFWQNRFGHASRDHRALLEARQTKASLKALEACLFDLFQNKRDEGTLFDELAELTGSKYPLLAYLFFLKDMDRFMPIQPTGFDEAFRELGIPLVTVRNCNWDNYQNYNAALVSVQNRLKGVENLASVRLVDAHSFCWLLVRLPKKLGENKGSALDPGRVLAGKEKSILAVQYSIKDTVRKSNGQKVESTVKDKQLMLTDPELDQLVKDLFELQGDRCALTGIRFHFHGPDADKNLLPSPDRIDSDGHYERNNLQLVCRFVNFWKGSSDNDEFISLLNLVRHQEI